MLGFDSHQRFSMWIIDSWTMVYAVQVHEVTKIRVQWCTDGLHVGMWAVPTGQSAASVQAGCHWGCKLPRMLLILSSIDGIGSEKDRIWSCRVRGWSATCRSYDDSLCQPAIIQAIARCDHNKKAMCEWEWHNRHVQTSKSNDEKYMNPNENLSASKKTRHVQHKVSCHAIWDLAQNLTKNSTQYVPRRSVNPSEIVHPKQIWEHEQYMYFSLSNILCHVFTTHLRKTKRPGCDI